MALNITNLMQIMAAYTLFALSLVGLVLSIVGAAMIVMAIYEGVIWVRTLHFPHSLHLSRPVRASRQ